MPKKTSILIAVLVILTAGLVYIAIQTEKQSPPIIDEEIITEEDIIPTVQPMTEISFSPLVLDTTENLTSTYSADIVIDTNGQLISGVQLELQYDPEALSNVAISPSTPNLFGKNPAILVNSVEEDLGRITLTIALGSVNNDEVSGRASIATLTFTKNFTTLPSTQITVLPKTTVTTLLSTNSLLREAVPLTINLNAITPTSTTPTVVISPTASPL